MNRRDILRTAAAAAGIPALTAAAARTPGPTPRSPRVAVTTRLSPLGVQLYTVRAAMQRDVAGTLARVAQIGYREVEVWQLHGRTPAQFRAALDANRLTAPSAHFGLEALEGDAGARTIEAAQVLGHHYHVVAWMPEAWHRTLDDWRRIADRFNRAGERCRAAGTQFAYHNHDFEFRPLEGRVPFDVLCEATDRDLVQIELDLFWIAHGGGDALALFRRWPGRVPMVHVKDRTADGRMVDVGAGNMDWRTLFAHRAEAGMRHYFVEHDEPSDPFASITASYRYLSRLDA